MATPATAAFAGLDRGPMLQWVPPNTVGPDAEHPAWGVIGPSFTCDNAAAIAGWLADHPGQTSPFGFLSTECPATCGDWAHTINLGDWFYQPSRSAPAVPYGALPTPDYVAFTVSQSGSTTPAAIACAVRPVYLSPYCSFGDEPMDVTATVTARSAGGSPTGQLFSHTDSLADIRGVLRHPDGSSPYTDDAGNPDLDMLYLPSDVAQLVWNVSASPAHTISGPPENWQLHTWYVHHAPPPPPATSGFMAIV